MGLGQKQSGFLVSKKHDNYVTEVDHPTAQKTVISHKHRNPKGQSEDLEIQQTSPKSLIITDFLQYQEKNQRRRPTCPPGFSDSPPLLSYNVEKGMSSLIITDTEQDQEKNQCRRPTCPPGFSDIPRDLIDNIDCNGDKARPNIEVVPKARGIAPWGAGGTPRISYPPTALEAPNVVAGLQNIIENWRGEYAMGHVGQYTWF